MSNQKRKDPFHVNRDTIRDNLTVVRKLRLPKGAQIRARTMYATADVTLGNATVNMPYTGNLNLTVIGGTLNIIYINNPFYIPGTTPLYVGDASLDSISPGLIQISDLPAGNYVISVGVQTDARDNGFSQ